MSYGIDTTTKALSVRPMRWIGMQYRVMIVLNRFDDDPNEDLFVRHYYQRRDSESLEDAKQDYYRNYDRFKTDEFHVVGGTYAEAETYAKLLIKKDREDRAKARGDRENA